MKPIYWVLLIAAFGVVVVVAMNNTKSLSGPTQYTSSQGGLFSLLGSVVTTFGGKITAPSSSPPNTDFSTSQLDALRAQDQAAGVEGPY